ncbi:hypothetical protein KC332_g226 [Hortaea werneckii]|nr:hypothetical protein KC342_g1566 [Hortaea werneckii]KAI6853025.1 hypothetical protein KC350_g351 [Hortaea werneckii]KAI6944918.1 hypothetical protein KC341_g472 [Hortaea werneckii]KAI6950374.1 hypothetical protein KC348_g736 [Hortaea werneckii]KAI6981821.1 hypothetical protein KC321_g1006 [Hortaea werneckii]
MAPASQIPNHPQTAPVDSEGDAFAPGCTVFLDNACTNFARSLAFTNGGAASYTRCNGANFQWTIDPDPQDRSRVAIKAPDGRYLAASNIRNGAPLCMVSHPQYWHTYQGQGQGSYWLHTEQCQDAGFLHTWSNSSDEGAGISVFTNKHDDGSWQGSGWQALEAYTTGMSWRFRPTAEYKSWKAEQRQSGACCLSCTGCPKCQQAIKDSETAKNESTQASEKLRRQLEQREQALAAREANLGTREGQCDEKEKNLNEKEKQFGPREEEFQQREAAMKQHEEDLAKQEQKVKQGEERLKKSKKGGAAEHLESQQKADSLTEENERLRKELEAAKASVDEAKEQLRLQKQQQGSGASHRRSGGIPPPIVQPRFIKLSHTLPKQTRPAQVLPKQTRPSQVLPRQEKPAAGLPGYSKGQMERFQAVQKATSVN